MASVNVDWSNLGFSYRPISKRYVANFKNGKWEQGGLTEDANIVLNECAGILQYCQEVFEGLKAYRTKDGRVVTFRPDLNAKRMMDSAKRLVMPPVPEEMFLEAVDQVVAANKDWIPPF
ncbi:MAG: branched chain amino acid aminotransferase, partial [Selenomonas sp.]|nr:branched chain amino acid aminotransferase [Selenomonas sp.]